MPRQENFLMKAGVMIEFIGQPKTCLRVPIKSVDPSEDEMSLSQNKIQNWLRNNRVKSTERIRSDLHIEGTSPVSLRSFPAPSRRDIIYDRSYGFFDIGSFFSNPSFLSFVPLHPRNSFYISNSTFFSPLFLVFHSTINLRTTAMVVAAAAPTGGMKRKLDERKKKNQIKLNFLLFHFDKISLLRPEDK